MTASEMDGVHPYPVSSGPSAAGAARRRSASKIANAERWAHEGDRVAATQPARDAIERKFEDEVDPDNTLRVADPVGFAKRVANAKTAYYTRLARKSADARARRKAS